MKTAERRAGKALLRLAIAIFAPWLGVSSGAPIYPDASRASGDIEAALAGARATHRRVLVDFGGDWCTDCKVLDKYFHEPANAKLLEERYVLVHVDVGDRGIDRNLDIARRYGIPLAKGVPALAVLEGDGRVVHAQRNGEFESMRRMSSRSVTDFLERWGRQ